MLLRKIKKIKKGFTLQLMITQKFVKLQLQLPNYYENAGLIGAIARFKSETGDFRSNLSRF